MNEKMKLLAKQASADLDPEDFMGASEEFLELFAELIVRECAEYIGSFRGRDLRQQFKHRLKKHSFWVVFSFSACSPWLSALRAMLSLSSAVAKLPLFALTLTPSHFLFAPLPEQRWPKQCHDKSAIGAVFLGALCAIDQKGFGHLTESFVQRPWWLLPCHINTVLVYSDR